MMPPQPLALAPTAVLKQREQPGILTVKADEMKISPKSAGACNDEAARSTTSATAASKEGR